MTSENKSFVGKTEGRRSLFRLRCRLKDNMKKEYTEVMYKEIEFMELRTGPSVRTLQTWS
jgi:hypothetical protein